MNNQTGIQHTPDFGRFIGTSLVMQDVYSKIERYAPTNTTVFIEGQSGTGKEICAQMLHSYSDRHNNPFIALNCAALPADLIESALFGHVKGAFTGADNARDGAIARAQNGTLFLDEIGDMPLDLQAKILRFCQDFRYSKLGSDTMHQANIRLICASNKNIKRQVDHHLFREDLYYRLYVAPIMMPALQARQSDILDIAYYYLKFYAEEQNKPIKGFSENAEVILLNYHWPGNVRELRNVIHQIVSLEQTPLILASMLPDILTKNIKKNQTKLTKQDPHISLPLWKIEQNAIQSAINLASGNIPKAAAMLDVAPSTIYRKIKLWKNK